MTDTAHVFIIYPKAQFVSFERIATWFADAVANGEIAPEYYDARTPDEMADALSDAGIITRGTPR